LFKVFTKYLKYYTESKYIFFQSLTERLFLFILFIIFARTYTNEIYGEIITIFTVCNATAFLFNLGLPIYLQRETAITKNNVGKIYLESLVIQFILSFVYLLIIFIIVNLFYGNVSQILVFLIAATVYILQFAATPASILYGLMEFKVQFLTLFISRVIAIGSIVIISFTLTNKLKLSLFLLLISGLIYLATQIIYIRIKFIKFSFADFKFSSIIKLLSLTFPLYLAVIFNYLYDKIDVILISKILDYTEVSIYKIGYGLFKSSTLLFGFILISGYSRISYLSKNRRAVKIFLKKYSIIIVFITVLIAIFLFIFSDILIRGLYGVRYKDSGLILRILTPAIILFGLNNLTGNILNALGLFRENMLVTVTGLIFNIIANILFLQRYGIIASAVITVLTELFILSGDYYYINKRIRHT
jgi:O-antigen/teichoic acid export membrane protein